MPAHKWAASESAKRFAREVADRLSRQILRNQAPWQKYWDHPTGADLPPFNAGTSRNYTGLNALKLRSVAIDKGYDDPRWMTRRSAEQMGGQIRAGEKATSVEYLYYVTPADPSIKLSELNDLQAHHETTHVFNAEQIDGLPSLEKHLPQQPNELETCERTSRLIANIGAKIETHEHDYSKYDQERDTIKMPSVDRFRNARDYYGHAILQLSTWTGNQDRAPRLCHFERNIDDDENGREMMRTHIASMNVSSELRLPYNVMAVQHHERWSRAITHNPDELRMATEDAYRIGKYILDHDQQVDRPLSAEVSPREARGVNRLPNRQLPVYRSPIESVGSDAPSKSGKPQVRVELNR